jgi:two-component system, cell cycle response regulator
VKAENEDLPNILIIDDDRTTCLVLEGLLGQAGVRLHFAENGPAGLARAAALQPDAILLDLMMPGMDGLEVCRRLRADPALAEIHITILTALDDRDALHAGLEAGADDFIAKPFDGLELTLKLKAVFRSSRFRRLQAERARFAWMVESSETGYLVLDAAGRVQYANQAARTLLHLPEAGPDTPLAQHIGRFYQARPSEVWESWLENPAPVLLVQPEMANSPAAWLQMEGLDLPPGSWGSRMVRVFDVTEKMALHQDMRRFHSMVSHKLRTPVVLLNSSMALLDRRLGSIPVEDVKDFVHIAWESSERLVHDIADILKFINAPALAQGRAYARLRDIEKLAAGVQARLGLKPLTCTFPEKTRLLNIRLNPFALETCLQEILENAKKFHPRKDPAVEIRVELAGYGMVRVTIQDDGISLTPQQIRWALRPYFQGEKYFTGETRGMGLGLPTVATILWQVGGDLSLASRPDRPGLQVILEIPQVMGAGE